MATREPRRAAPARGSSTLRFLELGCGAGVDAAALAAAGEHVLVLATDGAERMCSLTRDRVRAGGALSRVRVQRFELVAGDYGALKRGIGGFDACLLNVAMSYVPWADHGAVYAGLRRVLEPATGLLVLADSDFSERLEPTLVEGAHHERRPFADYDANLKAAGFELQIYETFVKDGAPEVGLSEKTRTTFMTSMEAKDVSGAVFSRAKGEVIAMLARKHLKDFVELQESKFNVAAGGDGAVETETKEECALEAHGAALMSITMTAPSPGGRERSDSVASSVFEQHDESFVRSTRRTLDNCRVSVVDVGILSRCSGSACWGS
ncbi:potassium ion transport [Aureococcus anophagefferens]|nr:potassium ion transport [Aureococcus anophagefferens]